MTTLPRLVVLFLATVSGAAAGTPVSVCNRTSVQQTVWKLGSGAPAPSEQIVIAPGHLVAVDVAAGDALRILTNRGGAILPSEVRARPGAEYEIVDADPQHMFVIREGRCPG